MESDDSGEEDQELHGCGINALAAMTNRRDCCIFGTGLGCVAIWDTRTRGVEQLGLYSRGMEGELMDLHVAHKGGVGALAVLGDHYIISGGQGGDLCVFDVRTGGRLLHLDNAHDAPVTSIVQTGSEVMCITASLDGSSKIWDLSNGSHRVVRGMHGRGVEAAVRVQTDDDADLEQPLMLTGSRDAADFNLALFSGHPPDNATETRSVGDNRDRFYGYLQAHTGPVKSLAAVGRDQVLSGGGLGCSRVMLWSLSRSHDAPEEDAAGAGRERGGASRLWSTHPLPPTTKATTKKVGSPRWRAHDSHELGRHRGSVLALAALSNDSAASAGSDGLLRIWRLESRCCAGVLVGSEGGSSSAAVSPSILSLCTVEDRSCVLSGSSTGVVSQWDMNTAQIVGDAHGRGSDASSSPVQSTPLGTVLRSESFLKHLGGDVYARSLASLRKSLKDVEITGLTEAGSPSWRRRRQQQRQQQQGPWWWRREGQTEASASNKGRLWRYSKQVTDDGCTIARPADNSPSVLHVGRRYDLARVRPETGSHVRISYVHPPTTKRRKSRRRLSSGEEATRAVAAGFR